MTKEECSLGLESPGPVRADAALVAEGWTARFLVDPARIEELSDAYRQAGFEVKAARVRPEDFDERCGICPLTACATYLMLYTRRGREVNR